MDEVFDRLAAILRAHGNGLVAVVDTPDELRFDVPLASAGAGAATPKMFAAVQRKKSYVALHVFTLYGNEAVLARVPEGLRARMQGKTCFNFNRAEQVRGSALVELLAVTCESV